MVVGRIRDISTFSWVQILIEIHVDVYRVIDRLYTWVIIHLYFLVGQLRRIETEISQEQ